MNFLTLITSNAWDLSSAGRASALQAEGHRFKSCRSHLFFVNIKYGGIAQLARARGSYPRCRWFKSSSRYFEKGLYKPFFYFFKEQTDTGKLIIAKVTVVAARRVSGESSSVK